MNTTVVFFNWGFLKLLRKLYYKRFKILYYNRIYATQMC